MRWVLKHPCHLCVPFQDICILRTTTPSALMNMISPREFLDVVLIQHNEDGSKMTVGKLGPNLWGACFLGAGLQFNSQRGHSTGTTVWPSANGHPEKATWDHWNVLLQRSSTRGSFCHQTYLSFLCCCQVTNVTIKIPLPKATSFPREWKKPIVVIFPFLLLVFTRSLWEGKWTGKLWQRESSPKQISVW